MLYFYFEAQTGVIHLTLPKAPSNYWRYTFRREHLAAVKVIRDHAAVTDHGYEYEPADLEWIEANAIDRPGVCFPRPQNPNI